MKILGVGESVIDNVYIIKNDKKNDSQSITDSKSQHIGGPVLSALILLSRFNLDCTFLTSIGKDHEGELIKRKLKEEKVKLVKHLQHKTKINSIIIDPKNGQRRKFRGSVKHSFINNISIQFIRQFDFIIIDRHERKVFYEIIRKKKSSAKIVIDQSTEVSNFTLDMMKYADFPILPIESLLHIAKNKGLNKCLKITYKICAKPFIVTIGELGSMVYDGIKPQLIPAIDIKAIDTTGAGDVYRGAFVYGITQGWNLYECARYSNAVAALECTRLGNITAIPTKKEVHSFLNSSMQKKLVSMSNINSYFLSLG